MTETHIGNLIVGQGLAGTLLAWRLLDAGQPFRILDRRSGPTASRVAAGLVTPRTGRRMTFHPDFPDDWHAARTCYTDLERRLSRSLWTEQNAIRLFVRRSDEQMFLQQRAIPNTELTAWSGRIQKNGPCFQGVCMRPAARLNVRAFLDLSLDAFADRGLWLQDDLQLPDDLVLSPGGVRIPRLNLHAERVIFCQGAASNPWFAGLPDHPCRGDILNLSLEGFLPSEVVHHSMWLAPEPDGTITAGATYDWTVTENRPVAAGRREILRSVRRFTEGPIRVHRHVAAVRPTMKDRRPVLGHHPQHPRLWIFNGLGSRGVLTAPRLARILTSAMLNGTDIPQDLRPDRRRGSAPSFVPLTRQAQDHIAPHIRPGDVVIDATVGNGFDTVFLSACTGPTGQVHGFDIQQQAITSTARRLEAAGCRNVRLHQRCHSELSCVVQEPVSAAMFNLGYLPRGDHTVITRPETTLAALNQVLDLLTNDGIITVLAYRGHPGGAEEGAAVESWLREQKDCTLEVISSRPPRSTSPVLYILRRQNRSAAGRQTEQIGSP